MLQPFFLSAMQEVIKADTDSIVEAVKTKALDVETFYNHVFDGTIKQYYTSVLAEIASDLLTLPIERQCAGLELLEGDDAIDEIADAICDIALVLGSWFLKDPKTVQVDIANALTEAPAADIREARLLRRHKLLN